MELHTQDSVSTFSSTLTHSSLVSLTEDVDLNAYIDPQELEHDLEDDPQELILTADEINALSQFSLIMDNYNPHYSTRPLPPSSPSAASSTPLAGGYNNEVSTTPLTETAPPGSSSVTQWGTPPGSSTYQDQPQPHYNYPQLQPRARSHTVPDVKYMINDYSTQPRAGPMFPPLDLHAAQLQFPVNSPMQASLHTLSPTHQSMPPLYPIQGSPSDLQFPFQQTPVQGGTSTTWVDSSTPIAYPFPIMQSQTRSHSYPEMPMTMPSVSQDLNRPMFERPNGVVLPEHSLLPNKAESIPYKQEEFTQDDIHVLKSLLSSGERVKWRYISSRLSSLSGRRATSATCLKKSKELFKLPSERHSGTLGSSLAYVVHNSWDKIKEDALL